jgi:hypothetical protein
MVYIPPTIKIVRMGLKDNETLLEQIKKIYTHFISFIIF